MGLDTLFIVIGAQVVVFQLLATRWSRSLPEFLVGSRDLPETVAAAVARYRIDVGSARRVFGVVLLAAAAATAFLPGIGEGPRKLGLAAISLLSALGLVFSFSRDRRELAQISMTLPEPETRTASLRRRSLWEFYPPAWEMIPPAIFLATVGFTCWTALTSPHRSVETGWVLLPLLQAAFVAAGFLFSRRYAEERVGLSQRARAHLGTPEDALKLDRRLQSLELRALLGSKIGVTLLLALSQVEQLIASSGREQPEILALASWAVVAALLLLFAAYLLQSSARRRRGVT
jgi:hypothetical protein